jgi:hypothetical protein
MLWKDGRFDLRPSYYVPEGSPTESEEGNCQIRVLDAFGQVVSQLSFPVEFAIRVEPIGEFPTDSVPIVVKLGFPIDAEFVEIVKDGQTITTVNILNKLLVDAVNAIPINAFVRDNTGRWKALTNKASAIEKQLKSGDIMGACQRLRHDLKKHVENWLKDGCQKATPLEMTKEELLLLIDKLIMRLEKRLTS